MWARQKCLWANEKRAMTSSSSGTQQQLQQPALLAPAAGDPDDLEKKSSTTLNFIDFCDFKFYLKWMEIWKSNWILFLSEWCRCNFMFETLKPILWYLISDYNYNGHASSKQFKLDILVLQVSLVDHDHINSVFEDLALTLWVWTRSQTRDSVRAGVRAFWIYFV